MIQPLINLPSSRQFELALHVLCLNHQKALLPRGLDPLEQARQWEEKQNQEQDGKRQYGSQRSIAQIRWNILKQIEQYLLKFSPKRKSSSQRYRDEICLVARLVERTMFILSRSLQTYRRVADDSEMLVKRIKYICYEHAKKIVKNQRIHKKSSLQLARRYRSKSAACAA
mmetsp:Transcript_6090/g.8866  ORF Transcript_6090/g.8866 Transcript_6090/m.8866 type:complete len:170 (-) Transcript_6090:235-744(-)|eukprot:CAMPEP_0196812918 /NCGR_PEP_ID=MMETSP1362-20130617/32209_1 /TAXON_ID=163516 /ORGANISM="Leptocylindrus danicus, Strain CCMP1856" /LENGTH=169 /DNA_ID=CAMNT_0042188867 /DNA_START=264 /DNA_END=773 /DNA_ORIENTATION=+